MSGNQEMQSQAGGVVIYPDKSVMSGQCLNGRLNFSNWLLSDYFNRLMSLSGPIPDGNSVHYVFPTFKSQIIQTSQRSTYFATLIGYM